MLWYNFSILIRHSINGLVTDRSTKLCCRGFILALFQSTTANQIDSERTRDYKRLLPVCEAEILRVTVKRIDVMVLCFVVRDLFHVYLNRFEFHFLRLHINKTNKFCFFMHNGRVPGIAK